MKNKWVDKKKYEYSPRDWYKISFLHKIHQKVVGVPLTDTLIIFYMATTLIFFLLSFILN